MEVFCTFFFEKNQKFYYFFISSVKIWLVQLKLKFLVSCHSQICLILTKNGQKQVILGLKWLKIELFCLIMSYFFLTLCLKLYLDTLEHKSQWLPWVNSFLALFWLFKVPRTLHFGGLNLYFDYFLREKHSEVKRPRKTAC